MDKKTYFFLKNKIFLFLKDNMNVKEIFMKDKLFKLINAIKIKLMKIVF